MLAHKDVSVRNGAVSTQESGTVPVNTNSTMPARESGTVQVGSSSVAASEMEAYHLRLVLCQP